ncbi:hypothetical protein AB0I98_35815 [Streptomyces sp. NPDC050211]|uniref:hypothetical protein n=1 Tax=Streptomyces sp. NPDC050211 TaxID=3154932 RepID=UPI00343033E4
MRPELTAFATDDGPEATMAVVSGRRRQGKSGGMPIDVSYGTVADPHTRTSHEVDVVVRGAVGQGNGVLLSLGEAKWDRVMSTGHLDRLRHIKSLLAGRGQDVSAVRLACYSGAGFTDDLRAAADAAGDVVLVDLGRLYGGE